MTNWNDPKTSNTHADELAATRGRDESNARMDYSADSNIPDDTIRWNAATQRFEKWDTGTSSWLVLSSLYDLTVSQANNAAKLNNQTSAWHLDRANHTGSQALSTISDAGTAAAQADTRYAHRANNLSDLGNAATARNNLGLPAALKDGGADQLDASELAGGLGTADEVLKTNGAAAYWQKVFHNEILGVGINDHHDRDHAITHRDGHGDELDAGHLAGALGTNGEVLRTNGAAAYWGPGISAGSVGRSELKTSYGTVSTVVDTGLVNLTLPGGEYGFYPQVYHTDPAPVTAQISPGIITTTPTTNIAIGGGWTGHPVYARQRYVTASGEVFWLFILRDKKTGEDIASYLAPDHPCFGNGGDPEEVPHPFPDYDPEAHEIIVVNPTIEEMRQLRAEAKEHKYKSEVEAIQYGYRAEVDSAVKWPAKEVTVGISDDLDWPFSGGAGEVDSTPIKKVIPKPDYIKIGKMVAHGGKID